MPTPPQAPVDPRDVFAAEVMDFLNALPNVLSVTRVPDSFAVAVELEDGGAPTLFLDNAFADTRELSPEDRAARLAFMFGSLAEPRRELTWDEARGALVPILRGATYGIELWASQPDAAPLRRPFLPFLDVVVALDEPRTMSLVGRSKVAGWGITEEEVLAAVQRNLRLFAETPIQLHDDVHGPLWIVASDDTYEASRLLVPGWLASFRGRVDGNPTAIVPDRALVLVGGDARVEMLRRLLEKADREFNASTRRVSPALYTVDKDDAVVPYAPPADHPLAAEVRLAHEQLANYEYGTQKAALDEAYEREGRDVFVANYQVYRTKAGGVGSTGGVRSLSVWTQGVETYLPRTEVVVLLTPGATPDDDPTVVEVPFEELLHRLTPVAGLHPARFATGEFPS
jgi:hypothetical protein